MTRATWLLAGVLLTFAQQPPAAPPASPVPATKLQTRWAAQVTPDKVLPEYPRPQMVRPQWKNLNGEWTYAITDGAAPRPQAFDGRILVPFPIESQLSRASVRVLPEQRLWYRRTFTPPALAAGNRLLLHFGAVDWEAVVYVNGQQVAEHKGGYDPFSADITAALKAGGGEQELVVAVRDATDAGQQPRGKQVLKPQGIYYTAVTGIWQTVWLEPVPARHVTAVRIDPDLEANAVQITVSAEGSPGRVAVSVLDGTREVAAGAGTSGTVVTLPIPNAHRWSPSDPFLYNLKLRLDGGDAVDSYFGMRSIAVRPDPAGVPRLFLNGAPLFQLGLLDQGWWPDGLYTAPTDEALASDIVQSKALGFNMIRKHVKVEPARWYYHADRLGVLVWQDMPSANNKGAEAEAQFSVELKAMIDALRSHPSIVMWVPFNEGWGQHATEKVTGWVASYDPTRPVNNTSGWTDMKVGSVVDLHSYPGPATPPIEKTRAAVLGEFGGLGLPIDTHTWLDKGNWGYRSYTSLDELNTAYLALLSQLRYDLADGLAAAIYTQTTDVEVEVNGVMTYDRAVVKLSPQSIAANKRMYDAPPTVTHLAPAADKAPRTWRYTTTAPAANWFEAAFDDSAWQSGPGGFGAKDTRHARVGTEWRSPDIWLRGSFDLPSASAANPHLRIYHDEDAQVYVNGKLVSELTGSNSGYAYVPLGAEGRAALEPGKNAIAVHVKQTRGGQFIDVGLVDIDGR